MCNMCNIGLSLPDEEAAYTAEFHRAQGNIDAAKHHSLRRIDEIEELLGVKAERNEFLVQGVTDYPGMENAEIWWPKIASEPYRAKSSMAFPRKSKSGTKTMPQETIPP